MTCRPRATTLLAAAILALLGVLAAPAAATCPGGAPACPYSAASETGQRTGGVLRFPQAVAVAPDGTVYVGDQGSHTVQAFRPDGSFAGELGSPGSRPARISAVGALAAAGDGSVVVADGRNKVMRFAPGGELLASWGRTGDGVGEFRFGGGRGNDAGAGGGLAVGGDAVYVADSGNNRIQRFTLDGGNGAQIVPPGTLGYPKGLAVRRTRLFVADNQNHRVLVMDTGGRLLRTIRTDQSVGRGDLSHPYGVATDPQGRVFVADNMNHRVVRFSTAPTSYKYKARWGAYGTRPGELAYPRAITADAQGQIYVTNTGNDRVDVYDRGGSLQRSIGTSGRAPGQFNDPAGVASDPAGFRAVTDSVNGRVQILAPDGSVAAVWGTPNPGPTILLRPVAVVFDGAGNAYVLDQRRGRIFVFSRATGKPMRSIATAGKGPGQLNDPSDLAMDAAGNLYVADSGNRRIARFSNRGDYLGSIGPAGNVRGVTVTPDGSRIYAASANNRIYVWSPDGRELDWFGGTGRKLGKLNSPGQMTIDGGGNVWVTDRGNSRVQQFGPSGERLQMFGTRGSALGEFIRPTGVALDCNGRVTVTDTDNNRVQTFHLAAAPPPSCGELPPVATPPPPRVPTLPMPDGPAVDVRTLRSTKLLTLRNLPVRIGCDSACKLDATVNITPRSTPRRGRRPVAISLRRRAEIRAGGSALVRFRLDRREARRLRRALRGRKGLFADLTLTATAAAGEPTQVSQRVLATG